MGSKGGAEVCELVAMYLLHSLNGHHKNGSAGLQRDDVSAALHNKSARTYLEQNIELMKFQNRQFKNRYEIAS